MSAVIPFPKTSDDKRALVAALMRQNASQRVERAPVSHGQQALWFLHQSAGDTPAYNVAFAVSLCAPVDVQALTRTFQRLVDRHSALRSRFSMDDGRLTQLIMGHETVDFQLVPVPGLSDRDLSDIVHAHYRQPFDLERGPLLRVRLFSASPQSHVLLITISHIVHDGWSLWNILDEAGRLYAADTRGERFKLPSLVASYQDFVAHQQRWLNSPQGEAAWHFWRDQLAGDLPTLDLPGDRTRPPVQTFHGASHAISLPSELGRQLKRLAQAQGVTPFTLMLTAYKVLLARYSGQRDLLIGTPVSGPREGVFSDVVGYFVNPIVIRSSLDGNPPFSALLKTVHGTVLTALAHQDYPFPLLVERLRPRRDPSHSPVFQASFVFQQSQRHGALLDLEHVGDGDKAHWGGLPVRPFALAQQEGQFDLELELIAARDELTGSFKYNSDLFDPATVQRLADSFLVLLDAVVRRPDTPIETLDILSPEAARQALSAGGLGSEHHLPVQCLHTTFEARAREQPDAIAVSLDDQRLSYRELDQRAQALAGWLAFMGVRPGSLVGLCMERSIDLLVGIIGILKAGAAYVPLDPSTPLDRRRFIIDDSALGIVVTQESLTAELSGTDALLVSLDSQWSRIEAHAHQGTPAQAAADVDQLAYVIYTSGTTGRPKGVRITHRNVARLLAATAPWYRFGPKDVWPLFHSFAFDVSVWEMWGALLHGGRLVVVPYLTSRSPHEFRQLLIDEGVTVLNQTPSAFRLLLEAERAEAPMAATPLRYIIFAGEALDIQSLKPWFDRYGDQSPLLVNMYGITETTVHATYRPIRVADLQSTRSMIGEPIPDLQILLLDAHAKPVPIGVAGEIYVGGDGLGLGYLGRPELDQQRFIAHPFSAEPGARLYRSGDLARRLAHGDVEYLGRLDNQVKVRGFRIELGEIETVLGAHPQVGAAIVRVHRDARTGDRLVAWVLPRGQGGSPSEWRAYLMERLPDYMVPSLFIPIDALPLTGNGKVDHRALPPPDTAGLADRTAAAPPRDDVERSLCRLWASTLNLPSVGVQDNFFDLGGHSLLAAHLMARIEQVFGRKLPLATLFRHPTIEKLGGCLRQSAPELAWSPLVPIRDAGHRQPFFCVAGGGGNVLYFYPLASQLSMDRPFHGLQAIGLDGVQAPLADVDAIAARYVTEIRRVQPQGPYLLGGHCFGSWIAFEMAQQLLRQGQAVERVIVMDAPAPLPRPDEHGVDGVDDAVWLARFATVLSESAGRDLGVSVDDLRGLDGQAQLQHFKQRMESGGLLPPATPLAQVRGFFQVFVQNSKARYEPPPDEALPVAIALFKAAHAHPDYDYSAVDDPGVPVAESSLGWRRFGGSVSVDLVPGNHITMMSEPHVSALAAALQRRLG